MKTKSSLWPFTLLGIVWLAYLPLLRVASTAHSADQTINLLAAEQFLKGHWALFPFEQGYGGAFLTWLRAGWCFLWRLFTNTQSIDPTRLILDHAVFSFILVPWLMSLAVFYFWKDGFSLQTRKWVSGLVAAGFYFWVGLLGNDFYFSFFIFSVFFIGIKLSKDDFLKDSSFRRLFWVGVAAGLSLIVFRASLIYLVFLLLPFSTLPSFFKNIFTTKKFLAQIIRPIAIVLVAIQIAILFLGETPFRFIGLHLKFHFRDHLVWVAISALLLVVATFPLKNILFYVRRFAFWTLGVTVGFLPETFHHLKNHRLPYPLRITNENEVLASLKTLPKFLFELTGGTPMFFGGLVLVMTLIVLGYIFKKSKDKNTALLSFYSLALLVLCILAYLKIYMSGAAVARYLFPIYPALFLGAAVCVRHLLVARPRQFQRLLFMAWALLFFTNTVMNSALRWSYALAPETLKKEKTLHELATHLHDLSPPLVIVDDYTMTHPLALLTRETPPFATFTHMLGNSPVAMRKQDSTDEALLLLTHLNTHHATKRKWEIEPGIWRTENEETFLTAGGPMRILRIQK